MKLLTITGTPAKTASIVELTPQWLTKHKIACKWLASYHKGVAYGMSKNADLVAPFWSDCETTLLRLFENASHRSRETTLLVPTSIDEGKLLGI
jgi:hypothetical protein